jgi:hypothetical protein
MEGRVCQELVQGLYSSTVLRIPLKPVALRSLSETVPCPPKMWMRPFRPVAAATSVRGLDRGATLLQVPAAVSGGGREHTPPTSFKVEEAAPVGVSTVIVSMLPLPEAVRVAA